MIIDQTYAQPSPGPSTESLPAVTCHPLLGRQPASALTTSSKRILATPEMLESINVRSVTVLPRSPLAGLTIALMFRAVFAWAYGPLVGHPTRLTLPGGSSMALEDMADIMLESPWSDAMVYLEVPEGGDWIGCGSGFVVTSDGYVVTNDHVISEGPGLG